MKREGAAPAIAALVARGRAAWPELAVDDARFAAYVASRLGDDGDELYVEDLYLACACVDRLPRALAIFEARHLTVVPRHLSRLDRSPAFVDEVRQRLRERLFVGSDGEAPRLAGYSGRGPLATWVKIAAIRLALNLRRDDRDQSLGPGDEPMIAGNPELLLLRHRHRADFNTAFALAVAALGVEQRQLLRLHFLDSVPLG
ncbi:MAG TPA: transcriptional regulator, partial [Polyangia bacterium]